MDILTEDDDFAGFLTWAPFELKFINGVPETGTVEGYAASTTGGTDFGGDQIMPGAFHDSLAAHKAAGTAPGMLWAHDPSAPVGKWTAMGEDPTGLKVRGRLNLDTARGRDAMAHMKAGDVTGLSIGFQVPPGGQARGTNGVGRILKKLTLHEVSLTPIPMDPKARVTSVKSAFTSRAELEEILTRSIPNGAVRKLLARGWAGLVPDEDDPAISELNAFMKAATLELTKGR